MASSSKRRPVDALGSDPGWHGTAADADPGMQPERTALSWSRTFLACITVTVVMLRYAPRHGVALMLVPVATALVAFLITLSQRRRTARAVDGIRAELMSPDRVSTAVMSGLCLLIGLAGIVLTLV